MTFVEWKQYQDSPISEEQLNKWKQENAFKDGMAVITGRVWRGLHEGQYFNCIDCDNLKAIEEFCTKNDTIKSLQEMAQHFLIEQHKDNASKAHVYFYSTIPIVSKSSSVNTVGAWKIENNEVPAFEIKSKNNTISFCTPSVHKNGEHYEIIGTTEPIALGDKPATELMHHLDRIFKKYGLQYLDIANGNGKALTPMTDLFRADFVIVQNNNRHEALLRIMESLIRRMAGIWSLDRIKQECRVWNNEHCVPPLDEKEFEKQWRQATKYIILKIEEDKKASNDIKQLLEVVSATSVSGTTPSDNEEAAAYYDDDGNDEADEIDIKRSTPGAWLVLKKERAARNKERIHHIEVLTDELLKLKTFKTLDDTKEIRYYKDGAYHTGGENIIRSTLNKLGGYMVTTTIKREVIEQIIDRTLTPRSEFDKEPFLVNFKNCIVDLRTGEIIEHDPEKYLFTQQIPVSYRPNQIRTPRKILDFLYNVIHPSDVPLVLEFIGYCLIKDCRFQKALMCVGAPEMGKSVFLALITAFLGEVNSSSKTLQQLTENRFATAALFAKLANIFADLDNTRLKDIGMFKTVVSGDWIDAELKFRNSFTFKPFAKLIFSANLPPLPPQGISDEDAYYRRWIVVPFNRRKKCFFCGKDIVKNPNLLDELTTEDELSGLAYLAVKAVQRLIAKHRFSKNPSIEQVADEYQKKANPVKAWVNARCVIQGDYETAKDRLEQDFIEYCQRKDLPTVDRASLGRELKNLYGCEDARRGPNKNQNRVWTKIALRKDLIAKGQSDLFMIGGADVEELDD